MKSKKIANIVFYKFYGEQGIMKQACIFYRDGSVKNVSYEEGIDACEEVVKELHITSIDTFKEMINREIVHVMSGSEFEANFSKFVCHDNEAVRENNTKMVPYQKQKLMVREPIKKNVKDDADSTKTNPDVASFRSEETAKPVVADEKDNKSSEKTPTGPVPFNVINLDEEENTDETADTKIAEDSDSLPDEYIKLDESDNIENTDGSKASTKSDLDTDEDTELPDDGTTSDEKDRLESETEPSTIIPPIVTRTTGDESSTTSESEEPSGEDEESMDSEEETPSTEEPSASDTATDDDEVEDADELEDSDEDVEDEDEDIDDEDIEDEAEDEDEDEIEDEEEIEDDIEDEDENELEEELERTEKGFFGRIIDKIKNNKLVRRVIICVTALAMALGLYSCHARNTKSGEMLNSNLTTTSTEDENTTIADDTVLIYGNNDYWNNYSYENLLAVTENENQKSAMTNLGTAIQGFNGTFADAHVESDKSIRAALSFDEMIALQQAYNDYSKDEVKAIFNGSEINASDMSNDYKNASLQLMGAYAIETRDNPVDMSGMLTTDEGKAFYDKYQELFLQAKEATGTDKLTKVKAFYDAVRSDFPVTTEVRTEGISHADDYSSIESYKLSVTPMIAAAEMMYQNLDTDYTLNDSEIDFINDLGLCTYATETFEKIETITLTSEEDNTNPLYEQYKNAVEQMMTEKGQYVIDDDHRELTKLDAFQDAVNWHFESETTADTTYTTNSTGATTTSQETSTKTKTTTDYRTEETRTEKEITAEEKAKVDAEIDEENKEAKEEAEKKAEEKREELQEAEDKNAEEVKKEVEAEEKDLQDKIDSANDQIDKNNSDTDTSNDTKVNESDFGDHNVDFDDDHSDSNGNLDDSVENITTDSTGYNKNEELPDPNKTGAEFDSKSESTSTKTDSSSTSTKTETTSKESSSKEEKTSTGTTSSSSNQTIYEYEEEPTTQSNEDLVDAYIEGLADTSSDVVEEYKVLTR